jgi:hypothetical protein
VEVCLNKKTAKVFIYLDDNKEGQALMITPQGDVKALEQDLFTEPVDIDSAEASLAQGDINQAQYELYRKYRQR